MGLSDTAGAPQAAPQSQRDAERVVATGVAEAAQNLLREGFDAVEADGSALVLQAGRTRWKVTNRVRYAAGTRQQVWDYVAKAIVQSLTTPPSSTGSQR